jgi:sulfatase modifying factor 1
MKEQVRKLTWVVLAILLLGVLWLWFSPAARKVSLYQVGASAASQGDWSMAFTRFYQLYSLDPVYRDVERQMGEAARRVSAEYTGQLDLKTEVALLRWLAGAGEIDLLAEVLDHSTALIPAGKFTLGSQGIHSDESPQRVIYLDSYEIDRYEVTNAQYRRYLRMTGGGLFRNWLSTGFKTEQADWPVTGVSWLETAAYCDWAGKRLPSEAEWEKACHGPDGWIYPWGDEWQPENANNGIQGSAYWPPTLEAIWSLLELGSESEGYPRPQPVGSYPQGVSSYGILDMAGNASEWVQDWYSWEGYQNLPESNPMGEGPPWNHSLRGSGWVDRDGGQDLVANLSRCAKRNSSHTSNDPRLGFRCARSVEQ